MAVFAARKWKYNEDKMMTIVRIDAEARWSDVVIH
nr:RidA family protein [Shigella sonnei]